VLDRTRGGGEETRGGGGEGRGGRGRETECVVLFY